MRKILLLLLVTFMLSSVLPTAYLKAVPPAQAKAYGYNKKTYYYYPSHNIYYDVAVKEYIVLRSGKWVKVKTLPKGIKVAPSGKVIFSYGGKNIHKYNHAHVTKYGKKPKPVKHGIHPVPKQGKPK